MPLPLADRPPPIPPRPVRATAPELRTAPQRALTPHGISNAERAPSTTSAPLHATAGTAARQPMPLRDVTNTIPTPADASSDGEDWGSDFGDDDYTVEELTAFRLRFEREEQQIENAQRNWFASPVQGRVNRD